MNSLSKKAYIVVLFLVLTILAIKYTVNDSAIQISSFKQLAGIKLNSTLNPIKTVPNTLNKRIHVKPGDNVVFWNSTKVVVNYLHFGNTEVCNTHKQPNYTYYTTMIYSATPFFKPRERMRKIFADQLKELSGKGYKFEIKYQFIIGKINGTNKTLDGLIKKEAETYNDIIQGDFIDTYNNLPWKSLHAFYWLKTYCKNGQYLLKLDDDIDLFIENLYTKVTFPPDQHWLMGKVHAASAPFRNKASKWYAPVSLYPKPRYPPYLVGYAFILPMRTVPVLFDSLLKTPFFFIDDVYVTGICRENAKIIKIVHNGAICSFQRNNKACIACH